MATSATAGKDEAQSGQLPLFFKSPQALSLDRHKEAGLSLLPDLSFTENANAVPLTVAEFYEASRNYPILFTTDERALPLALLGIEQKNYFLDSKSKWRQACYVPAYVRRYPFILMEIKQQDRWILCIDEASPNFTAKNPESPFYDEEGKSTPLVANALEFCKTYQLQHRLTVEFCQAIRDANLLEEKESIMTMPNGEQASLQGFQILSEDRFRTLPQALINDWYPKGWVGLIYAVLISYNNWKYLPAFAAATPKKKAKE